MFPPFSVRSKLGLYTNIDTNSRDNTIHRETAKEMHHQVHRGEHASHMQQRHNGSLSLSTSLGFMTSILTSCVTLTRRPTRVVPVISKLSTAWSVFLASFITTSSVAYEDDAPDDDDADRRVASSASEERAMVISLPALDCMRYPLKSESILTCLRRDVRCSSSNQQAETRLTTRPGCRPHSCRCCI
jgi:hypothetical protein